MSAVTVFFGHARKFFVALAGAAGVAATEGILSGSALKWTSAGIAVVTAFLTYFVPNKTDAPAPPVATPVPAAPAGPVAP